MWTPDPQAIAVLFMCFSLRVNPGSPGYCCSIHIVKKNNNKQKNKIKKLFCILSLLPVCVSRLYGILNNLIPGSLLEFYCLFSAFVGYIPRFWMASIC